MTPEVRPAVDQIIKQFPRQQVVVAEDQTGGACVIVDGVPLGPPYEQADTWIGVPHHRSMSLRRYLSALRAGRPYPKGRQPAR